MILYYYNGGYGNNMVILVFIQFKMFFFQKQKTEVVMNLRSGKLFLLLSILATLQFCSAQVSKFYIFTVSQVNSFTVLQFLSFTGSQVNSFTVSQFHNSLKLAYAAYITLHITVKLFHSHRTVLDGCRTISQYYIFLVLQFHSCMIRFRTI
jgi:hypothetical protein